MRVDIKATQAVVFVGAETDGGFVPEGTGFIALIKLEDMVASALVTARHVIDAIPPEKLAIRLNRRTGEAQSLRIPGTAAFTFRDKTVDLIVVPVLIDPSIYDVSPFIIDRELWEATVKETQTTPHPGDEIAVVGLYTSHYGITRNEPMIRIGHIASLPFEPVATHRGYTQAILVEVHSIAGLSGSPVYWAPPILKDPHDKIIASKLAHHVMVGILIGYHTAQTRGEEIPVPKLQDDAAIVDQIGPKWSDENRTGFAVVLPIQYIFGAFERDETKEVLRKNRQIFRGKIRYRDASAAP